MSSPTVWRRWLALELRRLREDNGLAQKEAGKACGWSGARLSYIENGQQNVVDDDLDKLLPLYDVPEEERSVFYEAAAHGREKGFWERNGRALPDWMSQYVGLEQGAADIWHAEPAYVPGLLQTAGYAAEVFRSDVIPRTDRQINRMVKMRMARQDVVVRPDSPASLSVVMDESVLCRPAGSAAVMAEQLDHLIAMAQRPNVTVRVLPFDRGVSTCLFGAYRILSFPWASVPGVVYIEYREGATYLEDESAVDGHRLAFEHLANVSLSPDQSLAMMREFAEEYSSRA